MKIYKMPTRIIASLLAIILSTIISVSADGGLVENSDYWTELSFDDANAIMYDAMFYGGTESFILLNYSRNCYWCQQTIPKIKQYVDDNKISVYAVDRYNTLGGSATGLYLPGEYFNKSSLGYVILFAFDGRNGKVTAADSIHDVETFKELLDMSGLLDEDVIVPGDIYRDGLVNSKDAIKLSQYLARWEIQFDKTATDNADVFSDGNINSKDAIKLSQYLARWDVSIKQEKK